jgi:hypothetical protein
MGTTKAGNVIAVQVEILIDVDQFDPGKVRKGTADEYAREVVADLIASYEIAGDTDGIAITGTRTLDADRVAGWRALASR